MNRLPSLIVDWVMKPFESAQTEINTLPNGHLELKIQHEIIHGVKPHMLVWWFKNFTEMKKYNYNGKNIDIYRLWHPIDHIQVKVTKESELGSGFIKGAKVRICEALGEQVRVLNGSVLRMNESGITLHLHKGPFTIGRLTHNFTEQETGTLYESKLLLGIKTPIIGNLLTKYVIKRGFDSDSCKGWLKHNIEEVGNFEFFLPQLYAEFN